AIIETLAAVNGSKTQEQSAPEPEAVAVVEKQFETAKQAVQAPIENASGRFYSPLVKNIAAAEGISQDELDAIAGTGKDGRVTKNDILDYVENRTSQKPSTQHIQPPVAEQTAKAPAETKAALNVSGE